MSDGATKAPAKIRFQVVPMDALPSGRACRVDEMDGLIVASIGAKHGTPALCDELTLLHEALMAQGRWEQTPCSNTDRIDQPAEGLEMASIAWEQVSADVLPSNALAAPVEREGALVWLLNEQHASKQLCAEISDYGRRIGGDGLWRQHWPDA
ncbi:hypothetical protein ACN6LM_003865 [Streptomyces sp. SAS_281]|uniref:hypothetical protein n=1 Tax=Streptomyces sp. SAS_281 TaxID=3412744 RepID=UPI00403C3BD9